MTEQKNIQENAALWLDISVPITANLPVWPGDPAVELSYACHLGNGDPATVSRINMGAHTGTHVDAPCHFLPNTGGVETLSLQTLLGPCLVVETDEAPLITTATVEKIPHGTTRVLFKTQNSNTQWFNKPFNPNYVALCPIAAQALVAKGVQLVGIDTLSIDAYTADNVPTHRVLLAARVVILEGLYLGDIEGGQYSLAALPLLLSGRDGAPARCALSPLTQAEKPL